MKMTLDQVNVGSRPSEHKYAELASQYDKCDILINTTELIIKRNYEIVFESKLSLYEDESLTITYLGTWHDGQTFRLVRPGRQILDLVKLLGKETITFGSMYPNGYAVSYLVK